MSIHSKIREGRLRLEMTEKQFADAIGVTRGSVQQWEKEGGTAPTRKNQPAVAKLLGITVAELMAETGAVIELGNFRGKNKYDELVIPEFNTGGSMGSGLVLRDQPGVIRGWSVNQEWINKNVKSHSGTENLCIVTGFGDSMKGMFNPGDPLLVDRGIVTVEYDAVYFFRVDGEGFIKRLQRIPGEGLRVLSENKKYESWTIREGMDFEVFGRVLKAWQGEDF
jgi:transcriptional regulator with XRE-family HTH domain